MFDKKGNSRSCLVIPLGSLSRPKRSQAAMEFLMTYGWAILAAVIAIGVLAYFGVFSPGRYMPDICTINAPLGCEEHSISSASIRLIVRNGAGDTITVSNLSVQGCADDTTSRDIANGGTEDVTITCASALSGKFTGDIAVHYLKSGATIPQIASGSISGNVA